MSRKYVTKLQLVNKNRQGGVMVPRECRSMTTPSGHKRQACVSGNGDPVFCLARFACVGYIIFPLQQFLSTKYLGAMASSYSAGALSHEF
ncbi:MAG: hypothetical protein ISR65_04635 [Bacteriovoracaceae bacterium]|nr:hypothetical protein [Bacteriovoracaceae bacterium]